jgi:hypothetical protein
MVIADNDTRWNSTYLSIVRGLKLKTKLQYYCMDNRKGLGADYLEEADWKVLQDVVECLEPFYICTLDLQSKAKQGRHGAIWEALPAIEASDRGPSRPSRAPENNSPDIKQTPARGRDEFVGKAPGVL